MLELILVRHAEAKVGEPDYARPLTPYGAQQAMATAQYLQQQGVAPQRIIASPALRTLTTAEYLASSLQFPIDNIEYYPELYQADVATWIQRLQQLPPTVRQILIVGHNPTISQLPAYLTHTDVNYLAPADFRWLSLHVSEWSLLSTGVATVKK